MKKHKIDADESPLHQRAPSHIEKQPSQIAQESGGAVASYKEPWRGENCQLALSTTGLYEAGANLGWVDPELPDLENECCISEEPSWAWVSNFAEVGFEPVELEGVASKRIRFPIPLDTYWDVKGQPDVQKGIPFGLKLLAGHGHVWAWYLAMCRAMAKNSTENIRMLYECAMTVTICTRVDCSAKSLAKETLLAVERVRESTKELVVNFITFSEKIRTVAGPGPLQLSALQQMGLRFSGSLVNATMLKTIESLEKLMTPRARSMILELDRCFGRDVLSGVYSKVRLLVQGCMAVKNVDGASAFVWCIESMLIILLRKEAAVDAFPCSVFSKQNGTPSWITMAIAQYSVVLHLTNMVTHMQQEHPALGKALQEGIIDLLASPTSYNEAFPSTEEEGEVEDVVDEGTGTVAESFIDSLRQRDLPRVAIMMAEFLQKLHSGEFEDGITFLANASDHEEILSAADVSNLGNLGKEMLEVFKAIEHNEAVIGASGSLGAPKESLRELCRKGSDTNAEDRAAERADVWKRCVQQRKKLVTLGIAKSAGDSPYEQVYNSEIGRKASVLRSLDKGTSNGPRGDQSSIGGKNRCFVLSCDLMVQKGTEPWLTPSVPDQAKLDAAMKFILSKKSKNDIVLAFDGTMRECRRALDDEFIGSEELFVMYDKAPNQLFARQQFRRNAEVGYLRVTNPNVLKKTSEDEEQK